MFFLELWIYLKDLFCLRNDMWHIKNVEMIALHSYASEKKDFMSALH